MHRIWPADRARRLDDAALEQLYAYPGPNWLAVNFVSSADGAVEVRGRAASLSTSADRRVLRLGSDLADVLLVGARTAMIEKFVGEHPDEQTAQRRSRHGMSAVAPTVVVTTGRSLPPDAPVITEALVPTIVVTTESVPQRLRDGWVASGAEVIAAGGRDVDLAAAVAALAERGLGRIDCEGGPHLFGALLAAGLVDELRLTVSPVLVSGTADRIAAGAGITPTALRLSSVLTEGDALMLRYLVAREC